MMNSEQEKALKDYLSKSYEDRLKYWSGQLHQQMRWNAESGYDAYAIFSKDWLSEVKKYEPRIEEMLESIMDSYWANYWDTNEIRRRLK